MSTLKIKQQLTVLVPVQKTPQLGGRGENGNYSSHSEAKYKYLFFAHLQGSRIISAITSVRTSQGKLKCGGPTS